MKNTAFTLADGATHVDMSAGRSEMVLTLVDGVAHAEMSAEKRKTAFTLAEVLITLGIIGIIAALTIPNLMGHYRKSVAENKLKSTYSMLSNALQQVNAEHDLAFIPDEIMTKYDEADVNGYSWELSRDVFEHYFAPHFHITKRYKKNTPYRLCDDKKLACSNAAFNYAVRLKNGVMLGFRQQNQGGRDGINNAVYMYWDIILSPEKSYYVPGKDAFAFVVSRNLKGHDYNMNLKAINTSTITHSKLIERCNAPTVYPSGTFYSRSYWCTALIYQNGMNIPDDYPIKF